MNNHALTPEGGVYRKSSYSGENAHCVECGPATGGRWIRDSKNPGAAPCYATARQWDAFVRGVKDGKFD